MSEADWKRPHRCLAAQHAALVVLAGVVVVLVSWLQHLSSVEPSLSWLLLYVLLYTVLDLIRISFTSGSVVSLSFPIVLNAVLVDSKRSDAILIVAIGSLLSEWLHASLFRHMTQQHALRRAVLYASHYAVAGYCAGAAFRLLHKTAADQAIEDWLAVVAYALVYGFVSRIVLWPHDWWVKHLLASDEEQLPRAQVLLTVLVLMPIPVMLNYLYDLVEGRARLVVYFLPLLFLALLLLGRSFAEGEVENAKARTLKLARAQIKSPPNLAELTRNALIGAGRLVEYQCGAMYSYEDDVESFHLRGYRRVDGSVETYKLRGRQKTASGTETPVAEWPETVKLRHGFLGEVADQGAPQVAFGRTELAADGSPYLSTDTALLALPLYANRPDGGEGKGDEAGREMIGLLVLARPRELFTLTERDKAQALTEILGSTLRTVLTLESQLQSLYDEIDRFSQPDIVQQALNDLIRLDVDVPGFIGAVCEKSLETNLRVAVRSVVDGPGKDVPLAPSPKVLREIYQEVRGQTEDMPELSPEIMSKLQTVTSAVSVGFTLRSQWPNHARGSEYKDLYHILLRILDTTTVPEIIAQDPAIATTMGSLKRSSVIARDQIGAQLEHLRAIIELLGEADAADADARIGFFNDALRLVEATKRSVRAEVSPPERFVLLKIATTWQTVITNALFAAREGGAELAMRLSVNRALLRREITVQLRLENRGAGLATGVVAEIQPSGDYEIGERGRVELGVLPAGDSRDLDFQVKPCGGCEALRLEFLVTYRDRDRREKEEVFADRLDLRGGLAAFKEIGNPYVAGRPLGRGSPLFFGREDVFRFIRRNLASKARGEQTLLLIGERRTGKTSIVKQLPERLKDEPYVHVYFDCQGIADPGMAGFFTQLSMAIARGLSEAGFSINSLPLDELRSLPQYVFEAQFLPQVWQCIGPRSLLLVIDEFGALEARVQEGQLEPVVFDYLRSLIQSQKKVASVFVGTHRVEELSADYQSVLFNIAKPKRISFLDRESAIRLIEEPVRPYGVAYDDLALEEILRLTAGHPYFLQLICDCLMEHCNDLRRNYVTIQDVRDVRDEIVALGRQHVIFIWQESSPAEKAALAALASLLQSRHEVMASDIVELLTKRIGSLTDHMPFDLWTITQALERLSNREIVQEADNPGEDPHYVFTAFLYCELVSRYRSLNKVVPELIKEG